MNVHDEGFLHLAICWRCDEVFEFESDVVLAEFVLPSECPLCGAVWTCGVTFREFNGGTLRRLWRT